jgi:hypothetical protein
VNERARSRDGEAQLRMPTNAGEEEA